MHIDKKTIKYFESVKSVIDEAPFDFDAEAINPLLVRLAILTIVDYKDTKDQNTEINKFDIYLGINELLDDTISRDMLDNILDNLTPEFITVRFVNNFKKYFITDAFTIAAEEAREIRCNFVFNYFFNNQKIHLN